MKTEVFEPRLADIDCRLFFCIALVFYVIFVCYGSIVPLNFQPELLGDDWWQTFLSIPLYPMEKISRIDWASNVVLGIPLSFLGFGCFYNRKRYAGIGITVFIFIFCAGLSFFVEFLQMFFPNRVSSLNDILAQGIGAGLGFFLWLFAGPACVKWLSGIRTAEQLSGKIHYLFYLYLVIVLFYNVMPLDLTVNPVEIYHKYRAGRIVFLPFSSPQGGFKDIVYNLTIDTLIWAPIAWYVVLFRKGSFLRAVLCAILAASFVEFLQLFVFSRVTDITDVITGGAGGVIGAWIAQVVQGKKADLRSEKILQKSGIFHWASIALFFWLLVLLVAFWSPFEFSLDRSFLIDRLKGFSFFPFINYQVGHEYNAITQVFRKTLFWVPLGVLFFLNVNRIFQNTTNLLIDFMVIVCIGIMASAIEGGQFFLPSKVPDITDWLFELIGGCSGYFLSRYLYKPKTTNRQNRC